MPGAYVVMFNHCQHDGDKKEIQNHDKNQNNDNFTILNASDKSMKILPEDNLAEAITLKPGEYSTLNIDGFSHPYRLGEVYKLRERIPNPGIIVTNDNFFFSSTKDLAIKLVNSALGGGWKDKSYFNEWNLNQNHWGDLFK